MKDVNFEFVILINVPNFSVLVKRTKRIFCAIPVSMETLELRQHTFAKLVMYLNHCVMNVHNNILGKNRAEIMNYATI